MNLQENISRIKEVMGILSEQTTKVYTDKNEYDKALELYNKAEKVSKLSIQIFNFLKNILQ